MRFAFIGTGGTGKTTTRELIQDMDMLKIPSVPSAAREVFIERNIKTEDQQRNMTAAERLDLQLAIFDKYIQLVASHPHGIYERSPIDHLAYILWRCEETLTQDALEFLIDRTVALNSMFRAFFYFPMYDFKGVEDGFRETKFASRVLHDNLLIGFLHQLGISTIEVPNSSQVSRAAMVANAIKAMMKTEG